MDAAKNSEVKILLIDYMNVLAKEAVALDERLDLHHYVNSMNGYLKMNEKLGLLYLQAVLEEEGYNVKTIKIITESDETGFLERLREGSVKIVGISLSYDNFINANGFAQKIKEMFPEIHVTVGGPFVSAIAKDYLQDNKCIDSVMYGEGEATILELAKCIVTNQTLVGCKGVVHRQGGSIVVEQPRECIVDLDKLPFPKRNIEKPIHTRICTSRGCIAKCSFCDVRKMWNRWHGRSPVNIVDEIEFLYKKFNITSFDMVDSSLEDPGARGKERLREIAHELEKRSIEIDWGGQIRAESFGHADKELLEYLYNRGLERFFIGVESFSQHLLDIFHKRATVADNYECLHLLRDEMNFAIDMGFIMFTPYTTLNDLLLNKEGLFNTNMAWNSKYFASRLWLFPGSEIFDRIKEDGLLQEDYNYRYLFKYNFQIPGMDKLCIALQELSRPDISELSASIVAMDKILVHMRRKYRMKDSIIRVVENQEQQLFEIQLDIAQINTTFFDKCINLLNEKWSEKHFRYIFDEYYGCDWTIKCMRQIKQMSMILFMHIQREGYKITEHWI